MKALIIDVETTGNDDPALIEAAWMELASPANLAPVKTFEARYNPGKPIGLGALATHHILDEELVDCPPSSSFKLPDDVGFIIGHNIDSDWAVIGKPDVKRICTLALARSLFPDKDSYSQSALMYLLDRQGAKARLKNAHSALCDVENCRFLLEHIVSKCCNNNMTWEALWEMSEEARVPKIMSFGKHKGMPVAELPADYRGWLLRQEDVDPYLVKALKASVSAPRLSVQTGKTSRIFSMR